MCSAHAPPGQTCASQPVVSLENCTVPTSILRNLVPLSQLRKKEAEVLVVTTLTVTAEGSSKQRTAPLLKEWPFLSGLPFA